MNPVFIFIFGLLVGWLIEWLIDYFYWRRRDGEGRTAITSQAGADARGITRREEVSSAQSKVTPDDLKVIKGIGLVIERKLNEAGIHSYEQLGGLTTAQLRRILGSSIERLSDEESLLQQARDLARRR